MRDTRTRKTACSKESMQARVPKGFIFLLMEKIVDDLSSVTKSGCFGPLAHPNIDLSGVRRAIRNRDIQLLLKETGVFSAQSITENWSCKPETAFALYQLHSLVKKFPLPGETCALAAFRKFEEYEQHCKLFNSQNWRAIHRLSTSHPDYLGCLDEIREDIRKLMGATPNLDAIYAGASHGNGSAVGLSNPMVTSYFKWSSLPYTVSSSARPYAIEAIESDPQWVGALQDRFREELNIPKHKPILSWLFHEWLFKETNYCEFSTVPKSAVTDRSIAKEPTLNVYLQLGVDSFLKGRLKRRWGIDLHSQRKNQALAMNASIFGEDVTIDLKGASDTVAMMVAYLLLPLEWVLLLDDLRSKEILIPRRFAGGKSDEIRPLHKLSAMGNGFTFVIETVIFAALSRYVMRRQNNKGNLSVYGDDIVIDRKASKPLMDLLVLCGFMINEDKTFVSGPFRESCGVDCLGGVDIRPFFLKKAVTDVTHIWYIHNSLFELENTLPFHWEISFAETKRWLRKFIPDLFHVCKGPRTESLDTHLFVKGLKSNRDGCTTFTALVPNAEIFNSRAADWFFRKLMHRLRNNGDEKCAEFTGHLLWAKRAGCNPAIRDALGLTKPSVGDWQDGWRLNGEVKDTNVSKSAFDVVLREVVVYKLTPCQHWANPYAGRVRWKD